MPIVMPEVLVLCPGREGRRIVEDQLSKLDAEVAYVSTRKELRTLAGTSSVKAVVSDLYDGEGRPVTPLLRELNHDIPDLKLVVSYKPSPAALDDVLDTATSDVRAAFAARPFCHVGRLLEPLLLTESTRPPGLAESLLLRIVPLAKTAPARRCLTLACVNPVPQLDIYSVARFCDITHRTLYRHLEEFGPPKLLLSALAWPQVNYLLTGLRWTARQAAVYSGLRRPAMLIDLLGDYIASGLWRLGLDPSVDDVAAAMVEREVAAAKPTRARPTRATHQRGLRQRTGESESRAEPAAPHASGETIRLEDGAWKSVRLQQVREKIVTLANDDVPPLEIVRRLWRRHELDPSRLYRGVAQALQETRLTSERAET